MVVKRAHRARGADPALALTLLTLGLTLLTHTEGLAQEPRPLKVRAQYLSARLDEPAQQGDERYLGVDALSLGLRGLAAHQGRVSLGLGAGLQLWRELVQRTPSPEQLRPTLSAEGEDPPPLYASLERPERLTEGEAWRGLACLSASARLDPQASAWPRVTLNIGGLWGSSAARFQAPEPREARASLELGSGALSPWGSVTLDWRREARFVSPWLYARWGGVRVGTELTSEHSAVALRGHELSAGARLGRASLGLSWQRRSDRGGIGGGLTLPLSAPLYLGLSAWMSLEGERDGRLFAVTLRWTGEGRSRERAAPSGGPSGGQPRPPAAPSTPHGPSLGPARSGPLSPLSPASAPSGPPNVRPPL